jgi:tetratricopeptide (TPR) repeat protein
VTIENGWVTVDIDTSSILAQEADYRKTIAFCEKGHYSEAKPILQKLIAQNPTNSEYHRIKGQILSDEGDQEEAINCLIDALRWDSKNAYALLMMGNIFAKFQNDVPTAMKYYDQALIAKPDDHVNLTNIGYLLFTQNQFSEAQKYLWAALKTNVNYANAHLSLGLIAQKENDLHSAFYSFIRAIQCSQNKDLVHQNAVRQAFDVAKNICATDQGTKIFREYRHKLEFEGNREIDIVEDNEIATAAKIEFAESYDRPTHIVRFKPNYPSKEHLIMHELVHLDFVIQARKENINQLFVSYQEQKAAFIKGLEPTINKMQRMGVSEQAITNYCNSLYSAVNSQTFNAPIDLFIENYLFDEYAELRPFQFLSLYTIVQEGLKSVTDKQVVELTPKEILSTTKIYNLLGAMQFKELYGLDFLKDYQATPAELKQAQVFYDEFLEYRVDRKPAEEYEMVQHWAEDLKLEKNFELVLESAYRKRTNIADLLSSIEEDPFDTKTKDPVKEREMETFQKAQQELGTNMAVVMYMVDAMQYFENKPKEEIKKIAFEIAMLGTQGLRPDKSDYKLNSIAGKVFTGYHILAYYYVSWAMAIPEMLSQLQLPYDDEYTMAESMYKPKK